MSHLQEISQKLKCTIHTVSANYMHAVSQNIDRYANRTMNSRNQGLQLTVWSDDFIFMFFLFNFMFNFYIISDNISLVILLPELWYS